jgi:hypothetical protein
MKPSKSDAVDDLPPAVAKNGHEHCREVRLRIRGGDAAEMRLRT